MCLKAEAALFGAKWLSAFLGRSEDTCGPVVSQSVDSSRIWTQNFQHLHASDMLVLTTWATSYSYTKNDT